MSKAKNCIRIGVVINTAVKPSRDILLGIEHDLGSRAIPEGIVLRFFLGSAATNIKNIAKFVSSGLDALIFSGISRRTLFRFLKSTPDCPPAVFVTYSPLSDKEKAALGNGATVMLDNGMIGRKAADFFISHGLHNFAILGRNGYREDVAGRIRRDSYRNRLKEVLGSHMTFSEKTIGVFAANEDYWEADQMESMKWIASLPTPCGVFVSGDHLAFNMANGCRQLGIAVPDQIEILGVDYGDGFCDKSVPAVSRIVPDIAALTDNAVELAVMLAGNKSIPEGRRFVKVASDGLIERGSTAIGRGHGHVAVRAKEYIRANASKGIGVSDVAAALGVSRRTLEVRMRESTGRSVLSMISDVKMERVAHLLETTGLPVSEVVEQAGYSPTRNVFVRFKRRYGRTMTEYRASLATHRKGGSAHGR